MSVSDAERVSYLRDVLATAVEEIATLHTERAALERTVAEQNDVIRELREMVERAHTEPDPDGEGFAPREMARFRAPKGD